MYQFYPMFGCFGPVLYPVQNPNAIATFNTSINFEYDNAETNIKKEQNLLEIVPSISLKPEEQKVIHEPKIETTIDEPQGMEYEQDCNQQEIRQLGKVKAIEKTKTKDKKKCRAEKKDKAYVAKQYPKQEPSITCRYIQKNFELNIINQVFSFLWSEEKSAKYVKNFFSKDEIKVSLYYEYIKVVRKFCKRYINKEYLKDLCDYQLHHIAYKMVSKNKQKLNYLSMSHFSRCVRHLIFIYLKQLCPQAILTSKKMRRQIWREHLIKCRLLCQYMFHGLSSQEYDRQLIRNVNAKSDESKISQSTSEEIIN